MRDELSRVQRAVVEFGGLQVDRFDQLDDADTRQKPVPSWQ